MALEPSINDSEFDLWFKIATNLYDCVLAAGFTDVRGPACDCSETQYTLIRKAVFYTGILYA